MKDESEESGYRRRSSDAGFAKHATQLAMTVMGALLISGILWLFSLHGKISKMEVGDHVKPEAVAKLEVKIEALQKAHEDLKNWMRNHAQQHRLPGPD